VGAMKAVQLLLEEMRQDIPRFTTIPPKLAYDIAAWVFTDRRGGQRKLTWPTSTEHATDGEKGTD
jgi:hypothetical protein